MATKTNWCANVIPIFSFLVSLVGGFLDIEELKGVHYGIDILNTPVVFGKDEPPGAVYLQSKYGQQYQCSFPDHSQQERQKQEEEKLAVEIGIPELLRPLETGPCLLKVKDWWTYEFCYGKHIRQYHVEDGQISGNIIYLGLFESEFDWNNNEISSKNKNRLNQYHSQHYGNGTKCDLTKEARKTEVRFVCEEGSGDYIARIDEPETCVYILTVHTTKICHHPDLRPKSHSHNVPIYCNPVISDSQYEQYLIDLEELRLQEEAEAEAKKAAQELSQAESLKSEKVTSPKESDEGMRRHSKAELSELLNRVLKKKQASVSLEPPAAQVEETPQTTDHSSKIQDKSDIPPDSQHVSSSDTEEKRIDVDQELMEEFNEGLDDIADEEGEREALASMKDEIKNAMESQFNDIIKEAENELGGEDIEEEERNEAIKQLSQTLGKLLKKLERTEKDIEAADRDVEASSKSSDLGDKISTAGKTTESPDTADADTASPSSDEAPVKKLPESDDDRVKVRITRIKSDPESDDKDTDSPKKHLVETTIQDELKKAGLDTEGGKIRVKIITAGYYDTEENTVHVLSEEDSAAFNKMIVAILGGNNEAAMEAERHKKLEDNYNLVWGRNSKTKKP